MNFLKTTSSLVFRNPNIIKNIFVPHVSKEKAKKKKSKKASHPPKPVPNSKQRLQMLHMDLCGSMRVDSINEKRRNTCFVRNFKGVDLLKGNRTTNLYTINLHEMASASPICLIARAPSTKKKRKSKKASHPPKPVPNSKQRLHLLHMDLCGPMRVDSINKKRY
ncbi:hypothetical protein Tco_0450387, partial [Tanacetum coccineum]